MIDTLTHFSLEGGFLSRFQDLICDVVVPFQEELLNDRVAGAEKSHAIENFRMAARVLEGQEAGGGFYGMVFQDSDVGKWLEAAAYSLRIKPDPALKERCDQLIALLSRAQHPDGYLNTYFTLKEPGRRWTNLHEAHELYCAGHLIEAACAHLECTGSRGLFDIMCRFADHIADYFLGTEDVPGTPGVPGHPEVELALMRLWRLSGNERYRSLAAHFINSRGSDPDFFANEARNRGWCVWSKVAEDRPYNQIHAPVREQKDAVGHAVRALYLYSGMADVALENGDKELAQACRRLWESITRRRMYLTAGVGSLYEGEAFSCDYHLPADSAYAETCASIALVFFARRLLELEDAGEYGDVMETALYNSVLSGMSLDGKRFFYVNPLEVVPGIAGEAASLRHARPERPSWFACACCPPNVARLLASIGRYAWGVKGRTVYAHLFAEGRFDLEALNEGSKKGDNAHSGSIRVRTGWPVDGKIRFDINTDSPQAAFTLAIRIPAWSRNWSLRRNGKGLEATVDNGYVYVSGPFANGDSIEICHELLPRRIYASSRVSATSGRVAFQRGPLVYCAEGHDNPASPLRVLDLVADRKGAIQVEDSPDLGGIKRLLVPGWQLDDTVPDTGGNAPLYREIPATRRATTISLIPYYAWANRGLAEMRVWLPEG